MPVLPSFVPLWINQGDTFIEIFTWFQADGVTPVNLTSYTVKMLVQLSAAAGGGQQDWSGNIVLGGSAGTVTLTDPSTLTAGFNAEIFGYYRLQLISAGAQKTRVWEGPVYVNLGAL